MILWAAVLGNPVAWTQGPSPTKHSETKERARVALSHADAMLAIGCRFTEVMTGFRKLQVPTRLIQIDLNPDEIGMNYPAELGIIGDAKDALVNPFEPAPGVKVSRIVNLADGRLAALHARVEQAVGHIR
jgi:thiamine pyrophosphate-dependent acetolactate synthase large subunit-like protein